ncbi:hypothetical protein Clacol_004710 [Clathrus columnatus]|uniref:Uncharacterized protein n=1 Tax=Clathrus columnatus TaxID=1419009 RepID=A0AAV5A791_9AGAM|nr:hypothetical protein Clacol_004710 [Clathrus columnatus]
MVTNWSLVPWIRWIKEKGTGRKEERREDPEAIESALDLLEGPYHGSQSGKRQKEDDGWTGQLGDWGNKQIERLKATRNHIPNQDGLRRTAGEWTNQLGGWRDKQIEHLKAARDRIPGQDDLRRTAGEWNDKITDIVTSVIEPQQGTLKGLADKAAVYVVSKALFPVRVGAAWVFTPGVAKWVVSAWRRMF